MKKTQLLVVQGHIHPLLDGLVFKINVQSINLQNQIIHDGDCLWAKI